MRISISKTSRYVVSNLLWLEVSISAFVLESSGSRSKSRPEESVCIFLDHSSQRFCKHGYPLFFLQILLNKFTSISRAAGSLADKNAQTGWHPMRINKFTHELVPAPKQNRALCTERVQNTPLHRNKKQKKILHLPNLKDL